jgi:hypothetical protein
MVLGMSLGAFTTLHTAISVIGIVSGFIVVGGMLASKQLTTWTRVFLATTVLTSATGFLFPFNTLLPSHIVGAISLVVLAVTIAALVVFRLAGRWRAVYVIGAVLSLYFNSFVAVTQTFGKVPVLAALTPAQSEPPFAVTQLVLLVVFVILGVTATRAFRPEVWLESLRPATI